MGKGKMALAVVGVLVMVILVFGFSTGFQYFTADLRGEVEKTEQTSGSGAFRIYSYDHFFNLCATIQTREAEHDAQVDLLSAQESGTSEANKTSTNIAAIKSSIEGLKRRYNADAAREETAGKFRDADLPANVPATPHEYGHRTNCRF